MDEGQIRNGPGMDPRTRYADECWDEDEVGALFLQFPPEPLQPLRSKHICTGDDDCCCSSLHYHVQGSVVTADHRHPWDEVPSRSMGRHCSDEVQTGVE